MIKIGLVQFNPEFLNVKANFNKMKEYYLKSKADIILYPELSLSGYNFEDKSQLKKVSITTNSDIIKYFIQKTKERNNAVAFGFSLIEDDKFFNSQIFVNGNRVVIYNKVNLFFRENLFFTPGREIKIVEFKGYKFGLAICFDWFHPEFFRKLAKHGADVILHSANLVMPYCQSANVTRSLENRIFIATSNRIGSERDLSFTGMSQITDPFGNVILKLGREVEGIFEIDIDPLRSRNKKLNDFNDVL